MYWNRPILSISNLQLMSARNYDSGLTLGAFLLCSLSLCMLTYSNFQKNGASGETFKIFVTIFTKLREASFIWKLP